LEIYVEIPLISIFYLFYGFKSRFYPRRSFRQQLITSQIRSHIEYLIRTNNILVLILYSKLMRNVAELAIFNTI